MPLFRRKRLSPLERQRLAVQQQIPVADVVDGLLLRRDGTYLLLLEVSTVNLDLLTFGERRQVLRAYAQFVNSLSYPVQIFSMAQALDLTEYLRGLQELAHDAPERRRQHLSRHVEFLAGLAGERHLQLRRFFLVVPYDLPATRATGFDQVKRELGQRTTMIAAGLARCGIKVRPLESVELVSLLHAIYNPELTLSQRVMSAYEPPAVWTGEGGVDPAAASEAAASSA